MPRSNQNRPPSVASIQREAVERLKASLFGSDPYARRRYIQDFHKEFRSYRHQAKWADVVAAAHRCDVVLVGDYHALTSCQYFAARLLEEMVRRRKGIVLAMEMVFGRHQRVLDRYLAGKLEEGEFLRRIRYQQDWGYPWEGYRKLFATARKFAIPVLAADAEPRGGLSTIRRRDAHAASRIASLFSQGDRPHVLVLFGESHLARGHLPLQLKRALKRAGVAGRLLVIVQNVESIYWELAEQGLEETDVVEVGERKFAVFNASPLAKYEAYRQTLDRWRGDVYDDGRPDLTPTVHYMIDTILKFLGIDPYRLRLRQGAGAAEFLVDSYPDVFPVDDEGELLSLLRSEGMSPQEAALEAGKLQRKGSRYVAATNALYIGSFDLLSSAEEATRFLRRALSGSRVSDSSWPPRSSGDLAAESVLEEALGFLGSKVIDPSRRPGTRLVGADLPSVSGRSAGSPQGAIPSHEGSHLGQRIYEAYHEGVLDRKQIVWLFRHDATRPGAAIRVLEQLRRLQSPGEPSAPAGAKKKRKRTE